MTAKEYLQQYRNAARIAQRLKTEYEEELERIDTIRSALGGDGLPRSRGVSKTVENRAIRLADKALRWKEAELDAINIRQEIFDVIRSVPGEAGDVLFMRYVQLKSWDEISASIGYTKRQAHNLERQGLNQIKDCTQYHNKV